MAKQPTKTLPFHYIKAPQCAEIPVHGAFGGINPNTGQIFMSVFSERPPIPQEITYDAVTGAEDRKGKQGVIRSVNAVLHFDINTALALQAWLDEKIDTFKKQHPTIFEDKNK